jgi:hypothetical protein
MVFGLVVFLADVVCRTRARELTDASRFIVPEAGRAVLAIPLWAIAAFVVGTSVAVFVGVV